MTTPLQPGASHSHPGNTSDILLIPERVQSLKGNRVLDMGKSTISRTPLALETGAKLRGLSIVPPTCKACESMCIAEQPPIDENFT